MPKHKISTEVLNKIKNDNLKPTPKWEFLAKKTAVWTGLVLTIVVCGLAASVTIFLLSISDWKWQQNVNSFPYIWFSVVLVLLGLLLLEFKKTDKGYKYETKYVAAISVALISVLGIGLHVAGIGKSVDNFAVNQIPPYGDFIIKKRLSLWQRPEAGFLAGKVIGINPEQSILLIDFGQKEWHVILPQNMPLPMHPLQKDQLIKAIGEKVSEETFKATHVMPFRHNLPRRHLVEVGILKEM